MTKGAIAVATVVLLLLLVAATLAFGFVDRPAWMGGGGEVIDLNDPAHQTPPEGTAPASE